MNELLAQIILAVQKKDTKGWGNILFIVFLAIFWAIGGILKVRAKKAEEEKAGGEQLSGKPGGKPAEDTTGLPKRPFQKIRLAVETELQKQRRLQAQQARRKLVRPQAVAQKVPAKTERATKIPTLEPVEESKLGLRTRQVQPEFQKLPELEARIQELPEFTVKKLEDKRVGIPAEIPQAKHLAEILLDYSDPNDLKRAILHYEILGRPLSLRGPSGHIIGL